MERLASPFIPSHFRWQPMFIPNSLRRLIGAIKVIESGNQIHLVGLPGTMLRDDILSVWQSSQITDNLFSHVGQNDLAFNKFFAPDIVYAFERMIGEKRRGHHLRAMKHVVELLYVQTWLKHTKEQHSDIIDLSQLNRFIFTPLDHQMGFLTTYNKAVPRFLLKGYLLGAGPGTGKTMTELFWSACLHADVNIIVCPKNAVHRVWYNTIMGSDEGPSIYKKAQKTWTSLDGIDPPRGMDHYIIHYDYLEKFVSMLGHLNIRNHTIGLDESHNMNEIDSFRVATFAALCHQTNCKHVLWESGTPVKALGGEMAPLLLTIDPMFDKDAQMRFKAIYGKATGRANDILAARMGRMTYKVYSTSVIKGKPEHKRLNIQIPNGGEYTLDSVRDEIRAFAKQRGEYYLKNMKYFEKQYELALNHFYHSLTTSEQRSEFKKYQSYIKQIRRGYDPKEHAQIANFCNHYEKKVIMPTLPKPMKDAFKANRSVIKYYKLKVLGEALGQVLGKKRAQCVIDMLPYVGMEKIIDTAIKKTMIFTSYVPVVDAADAYLKKAGFQPVLVYGKTNNELAQNVAKFTKDVDLNPLIATYASLSAAVPVVAANEMIMLNSPFRSYEYDQSVARTFRQGQDTQVYVNDVFLDTGSQPNISTRNKDILDWSRKQVEEIMNFKAQGMGLEEYAEFKPYHDDLVHIALEDFYEEEDFFDGLPIEKIIQVQRQPIWTKW